MRSRFLIGVVALSLVAAACGGDDDSASDTTTASTTATSGGSATTAAADEGCTAERKGGEVTWGTTGTLARGIDPTVALGSVSSGGVEMAAVFDTLMRFDSKTGEFVPQVAESLTPSDDLKTWTLKLRPDVTFGSGAPLTADVVKYNVERIAKSSVSESGQAQLISSMTVVDPLTLTLQLSVPWGSLPYLFSRSGGMMVDPAVVQAKGDQFALDPAGAGVGPYEVERFAPNEELVLKAKDDYWGGPVCIQTLRFTAISGAQAAYDAFKLGEVDMAWFTGPAVVAQARADKANGVFNVAGGAPSVLLLNAGRGTNPLFADVRVRQAVAKAMDLDLLNQRVADGQGIFTSRIIPEGNLFDPGVDGIKYDPSGAKALVSQVKADGWDGKVTLTLANDPETVERGITIKALLEAVGMAVTVENLPAADMNQKVLIEGNYQIGQGNLLLFPSALAWQRLNQFEGGNARNRTGIDDPDLDAALMKLQLAVTADDTTEAMGEVQTAWNKAVPAAIISASEYMTAVDPSIKGVLYSADTMPLFFDAYVES